MLYLTRRITHLPMKQISLLKNLIRRCGFELSTFRPENVHVCRMRKLLDEFNIQSLLDVGANTGQYYSYARNDLQFSGRIFSFEPLSKAFEVLQNNLQGDEMAFALNFGILNKNCTLELNISQNSQSSSFLDLNMQQKYHSNVAKYVSKEVVRTITIDSFLDSHPLSTGNIFLKIDVQGTELKVLEGLSRHIDRVKLIQVECSFSPLYDGEPSIVDFMEYFNSIGFTLISTSNAFSNPKSGIAYQSDLIFASSDVLDNND